jgi:phenylacetate-CoA ligase
MASPDRFTHLRIVQENAWQRAPAIRRIYERAGMTPANLRNAADLTRLPITSKDELLALQRSDPPFGGFLAACDVDIARIFVSPGPLHEPQLRSDVDGHGFAQVFRAAGIGPGDRVLNTWSYHLVPAGLLLDQAIIACGATVIPAGTGGAELQAKIVLDLGITCICSSTSFFMTLVETLEGLGHELPREWKVRAALLGGEMGDWMGKRRRLEQRYDIHTFSAYGTGDFGLIGYEQDGNEGYTIHRDRLVQICDPLSGLPTAEGTPGQIVVTTLASGWPLIRFGTGDVACALETGDDGCVSRISLLQGRVGQAVKAREIFIYPRQLEELVIRLPGVRTAQAVVTRSGNREEVRLRLAVEPANKNDPLLVAASQEFQTLTRLKPDHIELLAADALAAETTLVVDSKSDS